MVIVGETGQREVAADGLSTVLFGNDVIDFERKFVVLLRHLAVFTTIAGTLPDEFGKSGVHGA